MCSASPSEKLCQLHCVSPNHPGQASSTRTQAIGLAELLVSGSFPSFIPDTGTGENVDEEIIEA